MSDLIERLEEDLKWMTGYDYPDQKEVSSRLTRSDLLEAITALRTLQRIEGLAKESGCVTITPYKSINKWEIYAYGTGRFKCSAIGETLPLAVEAAVEKQ